MNHQDLTGRGAVHPFAFVQSTDPSLDPTQSVTANKAWVDTSVSPIVLRIRDSTNTVWNVLVGGVIGRAYEPFTVLAGPFMSTSGPFAMNFPPLFVLLTHI